MTVPSAAAWIGVPQAAARSMPVWNMGRPSKGWMRGPNGDISPPRTGWMNIGRPTIGAAMASAVAGARLIAGNMKRPPPMAAEKAEPAGAGARAAVGATEAVEADISWRAWPTAATASWTAGEPAASTTEAVDGCGVLPPRKGSSAKSRTIAAKGTTRPLILMFRTCGPPRSLPSVTVKPPPRGTSAVSADTLPYDGIYATGAPRAPPRLDRPVASTIGRRHPPRGGCGGNRTAIRDARDWCDRCSQRMLLVSTRHTQ